MVIVNFAGSFAPAEFSNLYAVTFLISSPSRKICSFSLIDTVFNSIFISPSIPFSMCSAAVWDRLLMKSLVLSLPMLYTVFTGCCSNQVHKEKKLVMIREYTGFCPISGNMQSIFVHYHPIQMTQTLQKHYKSIKYDCPVTNECPLAKCPIYQDSPHSVTGL